MTVNETAAMLAVTPHWVRAQASGHITTGVYQQMITANLIAAVDSWDIALRTRPKPEQVQ
jgi:hypothetical protein